MQPCLCPRYAHENCLARWQLQNAGKTYAFATLRTRLEDCAVGVLLMYAVVASPGRGTPGYIIFKLPQALLNVFFHIRPRRRSMTAP